MTVLDLAPAVTQQWDARKLSGLRAWYDAERGQPKYAGYVQLNGVSGDYISTPDAPNLRVTGDLEIVMRVALDDWSPSATQYLAGRYGNATDRSWLFAINTSGEMLLYNSTDGTSGTQIARSTAGVNLAATPNGATLWLKATLDVDNAGNNTGRFFWCADQPTEPTAAQWTQLGADRTLAGTTSIFAGVRSLDLGAWVPSGVWSACKVYRAIVRNGIGGAVVADFNASSCFGPGYLNAGTLPVDGGGSKYVPLTGQSGDYIWTADKAALQITGDVEIVARIAPDSWTPPALQVIAGKYAGSSQRAYVLALNTSGGLRLFMSPDGSTERNAISSSVALAAGAAQWVKATRRQSDGRVQFFTASDQAMEPSSWTQVGSDATMGAGEAIFAGVGPATVGATSYDALRFTGRIYRAITRSGIGGTTVADFNAANADTFGLASDGAGNAWFYGAPKHHGNWTLSLPKVYDRSGNNHPPAVFGAGSNQPTWLPWKGSSAVALDGSSISNSISQSTYDYITPNSDVDVRLHVTPASTSSVQYVARLGGGDNCNFEMNGNIPRLRFYDNTPTLRSLPGTIPLPLWFVGRPIWLRYTLDVDNGAGGSTASFYWSLDGASWVHHETVSASTTGVWRTPTPIGPVFALGLAASNAFNGAIHNAEFHCDGQLRSVFDAALCGQSGYTDANGIWVGARATTGGKLVVRSPAAFSARSVIQTATDDWIDVPAAAIPPLDTFAAPSSATAVFRRWHNPGGAGHPIFATASALTNTLLGHRIRMSPTAATTFMTSVVGDGAASDGHALVSVDLGARGVLTSVISNSSPFVSTRSNSGAATSDATRDTTSTTSTGGVGRIGAYTGGTGAIDVEFEALVLRDVDTTDAEHGQLVASYKGGL